MASGFRPRLGEDRKSTRLNSSHPSISYAVFCLNKKSEILRGTVIAVGKDYAIVDVGYKSEGQVPLEEFRQADGTIGVQPGDVVDVLLESRENDAGMCVLSKEKADRFKV